MINGYNVIRCYIMPFIEFFSVLKTTLRIDHDYKIHLTYSSSVVHTDSHANGTGYDADSAVMPVSPLFGVCIYSLTFIEQFQN